MLKSLYTSYIMKETDETYNLTFDFKKDTVNVRDFLENIAEIIGGFEDFNRAICSSIDIEMVVTSYLVDVESGSLKLKIKDLLEKISDDIVIDLVSDPKRIIGRFLVLIKHKTLKALVKTEALPQQKREESILETVSSEIKEININPLIPLDIKNIQILD
ncbi:MAG: hypothetical protein LE178_02405 [Endomicrobium sp.]|nr:hypothetical protein [Endomicrobium sp.]